MRGQKHLIQCRCVLPQYKRAVHPLQHQFIVFSIIEDDDRVRSKFAQCNNCGVIHKVIDICRSEIMTGREAMSSLVSVDDLKNSLPVNLVKILESNQADLPTWELAAFVYENKQWGEFVVLSSDVESGLRQGKYVRILGENLFKVDSYAREEIIA